MDLRPICSWTLNDEIVKRQKRLSTVIPAKSGIQ
jgi:hypothetical protein